MGPSGLSWPRNHGVTTHVAVALGNTPPWYKEPIAADLEYSGSTDTRHKTGHKGPYARCHLLLAAGAGSWSAAGRHRGGSHIQKHL